MTETVERDFRQTFKDYQARFGEKLICPEGLQMPLEDWIAQIRRCIDTGVPYEYPEIPNDVLI